MWPFKAKPKAAPVQSALYLHFYSFKEGEPALLLGTPVTIVRVDHESFWDCENLIPEILVAWWHDGKLCEKVLYPRQVKSLLRKVPS